MTGLRAALAFSAIRAVDDELLLRTVEVYEAHRLDFADAYLVASAERTGVDEVVSFDRAIDRVGTVRRVELEQTLRLETHLQDPYLVPYRSCLLCLMRLLVVVSELG